jgi:NAD+ synthase/NAD+ synthase (glutamine-hydrolysing)
MRLRERRHRLVGRIDSALTAAIAAEALGKAHVLGVMMPSPYSSAGSLTDSLTLASNLGIETLTLPIEPAMTSYSEILREPFAAGQSGVAFENIQARIRGNLLMALSNQRGSLLLTTGNKSELAVGYCTLYGDMSGGLAVIADVPKTMVYRVARWRNASAGWAIVRSPRSRNRRPPSYARTRRTRTRCRPTRSSTASCGATSNSISRSTTSSPPGSSAPSSNASSSWCATRSSSANRRRQS